MIEPSSRDDPGDDTGVERDLASPPAMPGWVKVFGVIFLTVVLVFVIVMLTGGAGGHGPGRH